MIHSKRGIGMNYDEALENAFKWSKGKPSSASKQAANAYIQAIPLAYAEAQGMNVPVQDALWVQTLYILNNLRGWRGEEARLSKSILSNKVLLEEWTANIPERLIGIRKMTEDGN